MSVCSLPDDVSFMHTNNEDLISNFKAYNMYSIRLKRWVVSCIVSPLLVKVGRSQIHFFDHFPKQRETRNNFH